MKVLTGIVLINTPLFPVLMRAASLNLEYSVCLHTHTWDFNNSSLWLQGLELHINIKFIILLQDKLVGVVVNVFFSWNICAEQTSLKVNVGWNSTISPLEYLQKTLELARYFACRFFRAVSSVKTSDFSSCLLPLVCFACYSLQLHFLWRFLTTFTCYFCAEVL